VSGSDGPSTTTGQPGGQIINDCASLQIDDWIQSPEDGYPFDDGLVFALQLQPEIPPTIALLNDRRDVVGAVQPRPALIRCLQRGVEFRAIVTDASGGSVQIHIEAVS
jgi:hypothetical protein